MKIFNKNVFLAAVLAAGAPLAADATQGKFLNATGTTYRLRTPFDPTLQPIRTVIVTQIVPLAGGGARLEHTKLRTTLGTENPHVDVAPYSTVTFSCPEAEGQKMSMGFELLAGPTASDPGKSVGALVYQTFAEGGRQDVMVTLQVYGFVQKEHLSQGEVILTVSSKEKVDPCTIM